MVGGAVAVAALAVGLKKIYYKVEIKRTLPDGTVEETTKEYGVRFRKLTPKRAAKLAGVAVSAIVTISQVTRDLSRA